MVHQTARFGQPINGARLVVLLGLVPDAIGVMGVIQCESGKSISSIGTQKVLSDQETNKIKCVGDNQASLPALESWSADHKACGGPPRRVQQPSVALEPTYLGLRVMILLGNSPKCSEPQEPKR